MAAELIIGPVLGLFLFGCAVFFASAIAYAQQQREDKFDKLRAYWEGFYSATSGHRLQIQWHEPEGWVVALCDAPPSPEAAYFRAQLRGDTLTVTLNAEQVALDLRFLADGVLISPLVPGLFGDVSVEQEWLEELVSGSAVRWRRE